MSGTFENSIFKVQAALLYGAGSADSSAIYGAHGNHVQYPQTLVMCVRVDRTRVLVDAPCTDCESPIDPSMTVTRDGVVTSRSLMLDLDRDKVDQLSYSKLEP